MAQVKLKDIAEKVGVSVVTVHKVFSGKKGISEAVSRAVYQVADELGYNYERYRKKEKTDFRVGILVAHKYLEIGVSFYWEMYQQMAYQFSEKQCLTTIEILEDQEEANNVPAKILEGNMIDGIIVLGKIGEDYVRNLINQAKVPIVLLDFHIEGLACDAVVSHNYLGMYKVTKYLLKRGHHKIAFLGSIHDTENIMDRYFGYRKALEEHSIALKKEWLIEDRDLKTGKIQIQLPAEMPTAFVSNSDVSAAHLYDLLVQNGYKVPNDISIVGFDDYLFGHPFAEQLTTYHVNTTEMVNIAVKSLLNRMKGKDIMPQVYYVDSKIKERSSVRSLL